ncbi:isochorismate synthase [Otariodibacter sp.]|uniref:isochorismate synthase n=1 Tax=Otariodibacter sp. TaxID=3030919 RepID=UPI002629DA50|nr:isochorismate synthase [Otariodibacter sp.]
MSIFTELKQKLYTALTEINTDQGIVQLVVETTLVAEDTDLLGWLKENITYPHFFWKNRSAELTFASIGQVRQFSTLESAQQFSQQTGYNLFGGIKFECECRFILPRIVITKTKAKLTTYLYIDTTQLAEEKQQSEIAINSLDTIQQLTTPHYQILDHESVTDFTTWKSNIEKAIQAIRANQFSKVVLANASTLTFNQSLSAYDLLIISQQKNLGCYHFLWSEKAESAFIGSSPEKLYQRNEQQFYTEALAGTVAVTSDPQQTERNGMWLLSDSKNIHENQLVVDNIYHHIKDSIEDIQVSKAEIKRLHNVQHLRRNIQATLKKGVSDADCLERIHPTAAVAGLPRLLAKQFIAENERFKRNWYAGTLGYFNPAHAEFSVALRSAQIEKNKITLYAGAGIVEGSDPESEWQEIERKSLAMASLFVK